MKFKQYFPYEYFDDTKKPILDILQETGLPAKSEEWKDNLNKTEITPEKIEHAIKMYNKYDCKNLADYTKLYLEIDILLLVFFF